MVNTKTKISYDISNQEFESARFKSMLNSLKYLLIGRNNELLSFDKIKEDLGLHNQRYLGIQTVEVDSIVGVLTDIKILTGFSPQKHIYRQGGQNS